MAREAKIEFYEHPDFQELIEKWDTYYDLYLGHKETLSKAKYLPTHELENAAREGGARLRTFRVENTHYTKLINSFISIWTGLYFRKKGQLNEDAIKLLGDNVDNIDGEGSSIFSFLREKIFFYDYMYGRPIILVDSLPVAPLNKREEMQAGIRAYFEAIDPRSVPDWSYSYERDGLNAMRYEFDAIAPRNSLNQPPVNNTWTRVLILNDMQEVMSMYYKLVDTEESKKKRGVSKKEWEFVSSKVIEGFEEIPIVWRDFGESQVSDYESELRRHYILESSLDCGLAMQAHQRLYATGIDPSDAKAVKAITKYTLTLLPEGSTLGTIPPSDPSALRERIASTRDMMFKKAMKQIRSLPGDSRAAQSDDSMREEKDNAYAMVQARLSSYESMLNEALYYYALYMGREKELEPKIELNRDIANEDVSKAERAFLLLRKELDGLPNTKKQLVTSMLLDAPLSDVEEVLAELESAGEITSEEETQQPGQRQTLDVLRDLTA